MSAVAAGAVAGAVAKTGLWAKIVSLGGQALAWIGKHKVGAAFAASTAATVLSNSSFETDKSKISFRGQAATTGNYSYVVPGIQYTKKSNKNSSSSRKNGSFRSSSKPIPLGYNAPKTKGSASSGKAYTLNRSKGRRYSGSRSVRQSYPRTASGKRSSRSSYSGSRSKRKSSSRRRR